MVLQNFLGEDVLSVDKSPDLDLGNISIELDNINKKALALLDHISGKSLSRGDSPQSVATEELVAEVAGASTEKVEEVKEVNIEEEVIEKPDTVIIYEAPKKSGFFSKLTNFIKSVFSN